MKVSKERRQLCADVTNSAEIEARRRRAKEAERQLDTIFMYAVLATMVITLLIMFVEWWRAL